MATIELDDDLVLTEFYQEWAAYLNNTSNPDLPDVTKDYLSSNPYYPDNVEKAKDKTLIKKIFGAIEVKVNAALEDLPDSADIPSNEDIWDIVVTKINENKILVVPNPDYPATSTNQFKLEIVV